MSGAGYDERVDVFSYGVLVCQVSIPRLIPRNASPLSQSIFKGVV